MICKTRTSTETPEQRRERHYRQQESKRAMGICFSCPKPAAPGFVRCEPCMKIRRARCRKQFCQRCQAAPPVAMGCYCGECCEWLARCEEPSTEPECDGLMTVDLEPAERAAYRKLLGERMNGQRVLFKGSHVSKPLPYEAPEYSVGVFSDAMRWEG